MKTLDDAVIELNGVWPATDCKFMHEFISKDIHGCNNYRDSSFCTREQFQQRAKELGFVNGYRYGVEYKTDGKRPDLDGDVGVAVSCGTYAMNVIRGAKVRRWRWENSISFKITDTRYKPADTSYLEKLIHKESDVITWNVPEPYFKVTVSGVGAGGTLGKVDSSADWYDYDNQKALRLPPVGDKSASFNVGSDMWIGCEIAAYYSNGAIVAHNDGFTLVYKHELRPNNFHDRKAKAERKKVVEAAQKECVNFSSNDLGRLYDKGFLKLPE